MNFSIFDRGKNIIMSRPGKDLSGYRRQYGKFSLNERELPANPMELFRDWFVEAERKENCVEVNAMQLATFGRDGFPGLRTVLLKRFQWDGFVFYTNYESDKALDIAQNNAVTLHFHWPALERQVIIKGKAEKLPENLSDGYFSMRPRGSQLAAWASPQSRPVPSKEWLLERIETLEKEFEGKEIPRPPFWGGYLVKPRKIEFWQGQPNRLHDRFLYELQPDFSWKISRLGS